MVQIGGKFQLVKNENFWEHLAALGIPEDKAKDVDAVKPVLEITIKGKEVTFSTTTGEVNSLSKLVLDEEVDETIALDIQIRSTTTLKENQIKIYSIGPNGEVGERVFEFYDTELIMTLSSENPGVPVAKRYYKRIEE